MQERAKEENLDIHTLCMDLNHWDTNEKYDVIVASYLHMYKEERTALFEKIEESLSFDNPISDASTAVTAKPFFAKNTAFLPSPSPIHNTFDLSFRSFILEAINVFGFNPYKKPSLENLLFLTLF